MGCNILVTAVGGDIGQSIARILKHFEQVTSIVGTDISNNNAGPFFVDRFVLVPGATEKAYIDTLEEIIEENNISCIVPVNETEIQVLTEYISHHKTFAVPVIMPNQKAISLCSDKYETMGFLKANNIKTPWTLPVSHEPLTYPCVMKNRRGSGSKGMAIIENQRDWEYYKEKRGDTILQRLLLPSDSEYTCGVYRGSDRKTKCLIMKRDLKGGLTITAEVVEDTSIEELCFRVAELLELIGSINIQLRRTASGPEIFEINPRFSSTVLFRHYVNFCDLAWSIEDKLGIKLVEHPRPVKYGMKIYRYYREVFKYQDEFFEY